MSNAEYIATKDVAKLIRAELAKHFAGIAFSVRTHTYSGGSHVNVHWQDGPSPRQVDAKIGHFCGRTFDGMDDSTHHHNTEHKGRLVHFGGSRPSTQRRVSDFDERVRTAAAMIRERCKLEPEGWFGITAPCWRSWASKAASFRAWRLSAEPSAFGPIEDTLTPYTMICHLAISTGPKSRKTSSDRAPLLALQKPHAATIFSLEC